MNLSSNRFLLFALLAALLAATLFSPGLDGEFLLDDAHTIVNNSAIQMKTLSSDALLDAAGSFYVGGSTRPLAMASFALDYWRHGSLDASTFKATNLLIHALTTFLLAIFLRRLLLMAQCTPQRAAVGALLVALVWAIHPLQVSSVLYVVQRMQTLATLFVVLALWAYLGLRQAQIADRRGWPHGVLMVVFWLHALASKEDAALLPLYCLLLELTVLRFAAAQPWRAHSLRRLYLVMTLAGAALYLFWALPHYWSWEAYTGRDFNSIERLLTQARVLVMYLGQIVFPLPSQMPFNYDTLVISRGLLQPPSTLPALMLVIGLIAWAWRWRTRRPLFALGVLLFFAGHFVSSNVVPLELVFEHRNHLPLIGVLLALWDLLVAARERWQLRLSWLAPVLAALVVAVGTAGALRAHAWGDPVRLAQYHVDIAPDSPRAWLALGGSYFDLAGRKAGKDSPYLTLAIKTVEEAAEKTGSPSAYANIVVYKTIQGTVTQADWDGLLQRLDQAPMTPPTRNILWTIMANVGTEIGLEEAQVLRLIEIITRRTTFSPPEYLRIGISIYLKMPQQQEAALPYFIHAAEGFAPGAQSIVRLRDDLASQGRDDWARAIEQANAGPHAKPEMTPTR